MTIEGHLPRQQIRLQEIDCHFVELPGAGPAVVLLHGIISRSETFVPLMSAIGRSAHVYAIDLRGHGRSGRGERYRVSDYSKDIAEFLRRVVGAPAVLVGHSLGGLVGAYLAANHPGLVRGLVLEDPPMYVGRQPRLSQSATSYLFTQWRAQIRDHAARKESATQLAKRMEFWDEGGTPLVKLLGEAGIRQRSESWQTMDPRVLDEPLDGRLFEGFNTDEDLERIICPSMLLVADEHCGSALQGDDAQRLLSAIPHCTSRYFADTGHSIHEGSPERFTLELCRFMEHLPVQ